MALSYDAQRQILRDHFEERSGGLSPTDADLDPFLWPGNADPIEHLQRFRSANADKLLVELGRRSIREHPVDVIAREVLGRPLEDEGFRWYAPRFEGQVPGEHHTSADLRRIMTHHRDNAQGAIRPNLDTRIDK